MNKLPPGAMHFGGYAEQACGGFIGACVSALGMDGPEVFNLRLRWDGAEQLAAHPDSREYAGQWRAWLFAELDRVFAEYPDSDPPVLIDLDPPNLVTQGGEVLCQHYNDWRDYQDLKEGDPVWVTPAQAARRTKARAEALKRQKPAAGMSVAEYEGALRAALLTAGFDFGTPDPAVARRVFMRLSFLPVACFAATLYYEVVVDGIEFGRQFHLGPETTRGPFERVALRFSSPELTGFQHPTTAGYCMALHDKPTFSRILGEAFGPAVRRRVSEWWVELRRYVP